jgi:hypothetical protein
MYVGETASSAKCAAVRAYSRSEAGHFDVGGVVGGGDWIRTSVAVKREIYSLVDLTTLPPLQGPLFARLTRAPVKPKGRPA